MNRGAETDADWGCEHAGVAQRQAFEHGPDLPMPERIRRYQENIRVIRASGCAVPTSAMIDSLDPAEIELWFADNAFNIDRLRRVMARVAELPPETEIPSLLLPGKKSDQQE